jgi:hypothetical protein
MLESSPDLDYKHGSEDEGLTLLSPLTNACVLQSSQERKHVQGDDGLDLERTVRRLDYSCDSDLDAEEGGNVASGNGVGHTEVHEGSRHGQALLRRAINRFVDDEAGHSSSDDNDEIDGGEGDSDLDGFIDNSTICGDSHERGRLAFAEEDARNEAAEIASHLDYLANCAKRRRISE